MTTICYKDKVMASDGKVTQGDMVVNTSTKKVFSINGCLVGFAGRMTSGLKFISWFQKWSDSHMVRNEAPYVDILMPEDLTEDDFYAIVCWTDGSVSLYEGGQNMYEVDASQGFSIGSGSPYALSAMLAGCGAEEAVKIACKLDVFSGGEVYVEVLDEEQPEFTKEEAEKMTKEELVKFIFPAEEENLDEFIWNGDYITMTKNGDVEIKYLVKGKEKAFNLNLKENPHTPSDLNPYSKIIKEITKVEIEKLLKDIGADAPNEGETKKDLFEFIIVDLQQMFITP